MTYLASVDDVADLLAMQSVGLDQSQAAAILAQASARFRAEAQCSFDASSSLMVLRTLGQRVELPRRPVISVDGVYRVERDGSQGSAVAVWSFDGISSLFLNDSVTVINALYTTDVESVWVEWQHGFEVVPEDVRWAVAQMAARAISSPAPAGVSGETIGAYSYRTGATSASGGLGMTDDEREIAHRYRPRQSTMTSVIT